MAKVTLTESEIVDATTKVVQNFLEEYRPLTNNPAPMVSINEVNAKSLIDKHSKDGYIIISPCRSSSEYNLDSSKPNDVRKTNEINNKRIQDLIKKIKASGYSYTPVYGGFIEDKGTENETNVYERSFIVYNHDRQGNTQDFQRLADLAIQWANDYNQNSVLICAPNGTPTYYKKDGSVDFELSKSAVFNDYAQEYFTDLHKNTEKYKDSSDKRTPTRFSFTEAFINPPSACLTEQYSRTYWAEILLPYRK